MNAGAYDADPVFQATPQHLDYLLQRAHNGALAVPDFQRDFTWEPKRTAALLRSLMSRFPAGTFLFWSVGSDNSSFGRRPVEGAPVTSVAPQELVLDGQQRLTSLYRALNGAGDERFFLAVDRFVELPGPEAGSGRVRPAEEVEFDDAIFWHPRDSKEAIELGSMDKRIARHVIAVDEHREFDSWLDDYSAQHSSSMDEKAVKAILRGFRDSYLIPLRSYGFPVVTLPSATRIEAVATVFETLNSTGKPLGAFELLTARFYPDGVYLRDLWVEACADYSILEDFGVDPYSILQAITLRAQNSAQRSDVLRKLTSGDVKAHWKLVTRGFARALELLQAECGVVVPRYLPYSMLLVPLAAIWEEIAGVKGPEKATVLSRVKEFFWCSVFMTNYDQGANSQAGADYSKLRYWLFNPEMTPPEVISGFNLSEEVIASATTRRKALYSGILALTVTSGARDFHSGLKLTPEKVRAEKIDSHHIFPKNFLLKNGYSRSPELVLNRALIDPVTNKAIGSQAPSIYFAALRKSQDEGELVEIMRSHLIDADDIDDPFREDDYDGFLARRLGDVIAAIEAVTGKNVSVSGARV
ncbi:DUF262 domain-containing protein [Curtobacterium flaccumfaciens pv. flaccumfaciens]|uniref:DUF262 domain-containing protein n=1 Tax=Curtobacterium flaccumfaciens pv. flaccumfaciens TaxID=138532 RepID=A0A9Q2W9N0_9MICO|nr:DUF262 domain-containing protein [Curtobacterium flaccumfaciens]MBT1543558.1 DUF262 domain-containing protein [Curtobacterium flaccumfaciens pv. flaccumfaciens]